jgi:type 1 glutamine amidotransferase
VSAKATQTSQRSLALLYLVMIKKFLLLSALAFGLQTTAADKKILLLAGSASHGRGEHEFNAGCQLLKKCLDAVPGIKTELQTNGWPKDESAFDNVAAVFIYSDGGGGHPFNRPERLKKIDELAQRGVGIGAAHYAVEVPKGAAGDKFLDWIGGYFEMHWSVNPHWDADFTKLPNHPVSNGVQPFKINDEWYYHMRFRPEMKGVTPILTALPPRKTVGADGTHSGNPDVRAAIERGEPQHVMWVTERPEGGRGFGFTGGHFHRNWGDENFRKVVLNALLWIAKAEVPKEGVNCMLSAEELKMGLDVKK